jgi:hypothetical protein
MIMGRKGRLHRRYGKKRYGHFRFTLQTPRGYGVTGRPGIYRYGPASIEVDTTGNYWSATVRLRNQEKDFEGSSFHSVMGLARDWVDDAPELSRHADRRPGEAYA